MIQKKELIKKTTMNLNEFRFSTERYVNQIELNQWNKILNKNNIEKINYSDVYCEKLDEINKKAGYQVFTDDFTSIYKIETNMTLYDVTYYFNAIINSSPKRVSAKNLNTLEIGKTFTYYYVILGKETPWWDK